MPTPSNNVHNIVSTKLYIVTGNKQNKTPKIKYRIVDIVNFKFSFLNKTFIKSLPRLFYNKIFVFATKRALLLTCMSYQLMLKYC